MADPEIPPDQGPKRIKRTPEVELVIGNRVKALRLAAGMSQATLGQAIGVSFQQIQKYERGADRIAVSTLMGLAEALGIHPGSFFEHEMSLPAGDLPDVRAALRDAAGLQRIADLGIRKRLAALIDALADNVDP